MPDGETSNVKTDRKEHRTSLSRGYSIPDTKVKRKLRVIVIGIKKLRSDPRDTFYFNKSVNTHFPNILILKPVPISVT